MSVALSCLAGRARQAGCCASPALVSLGLFKSRFRRHRLTLLGACLPGYCCCSCCHSCLPAYQPAPALTALGLSGSYRTLVFPPLSYGIAYELFAVFPIPTGGWTNLARHYTPDRLRYIHLCITLFNTTTHLFSTQRFTYTRVIYELQVFVSK